jgi:hypothetical protein
MVKRKSTKPEPDQLEPIQKLYDNVTRTVELGQFWASATSISVYGRGVEFCLVSEVDTAYLFTPYINAAKELLNNLMSEEVQALISKTPSIAGPLNQLKPTLQYIFEDAPSFSVGRMTARIRHLRNACDAFRRTLDELKSKEARRPANIEPAAQTRATDMGSHWKIDDLIVATLEKEGRPLTFSPLRLAMKDLTGKAPPKGTLKPRLVALKKMGLLRNEPGDRPRGYRLQKWGNRSDFNGV